MSCTYTAQGVLVCRKPKPIKKAIVVSKPVIENFAVREDPNEKITSNNNYCNNVSKELSVIASRNSCDSQIDMKNCEFHFVCKK